MRVGHPARGAARLVALGFALSLAVIVVPPTGPAVAGGECGVLASVEGGPMERQHHPVEVGSTIEVLGTGYPVGADVHVSVHSWWGYDVDTFTLVADDTGSVAFDYVITNHGHWEFWVSDQAVCLPLPVIIGAGYLGQGPCSQLASTDFLPTDIIDTYTTAGDPVYIDGYFRPSVPIDFELYDDHGPLLDAWSGATDADGYVGVTLEFLPGSRGGYQLFASDPGACSGQTNILVVADIVSSPFKAEILWMYWSRVSRGCGDGIYCPNAPVTRGEMASFLVRAFDVPYSGTDRFSDDETSIHEASINSLAAAGIAAGCTTTTFCPTAPVTREQMASFIDRALDLAPTATDWFTDDDSSIHEASINRLAAANIARGCSTDRFCPRSLISRAQMAAFLYRAR